jgi:intracellular sulfur oxidation DsrE/DsrF family protein
MRSLAYALLLVLLNGVAAAGAIRVNTPYEAPKAVFDIYLDDPAKLNSALGWLTSMSSALSKPPYQFDPTTIKVVVHGAEIVTLVKKNEDKYPVALEKIQRLANQGVEFKVCAYTSDIYGYLDTDFHDFVEIVPSAIAEIAYWQSKGYALIVPQVGQSRRSVEEMR